jgi:hypothetical protein
MCLGQKAIDDTPVLSKDGVGDNPDNYPATKAPQKRIYVVELSVVLFLCAVVAVFIWFAR